MSSSLPGLPDVRPEERRNTFAAFVSLLSLTSGHTLLETARDALFLSKLPTSQLPWMYLCIVVLALGLAQLRRAVDKRAIVAVLVVAAGLTAGFWGLTADIAHRRWVLYALYVWSGLFASWVTVQFWTLLGGIHTVTQAKRLYGFIGGGAVLGGVVGAVVARAALSFVAPRTMLLASAALFALTALPVILLDVKPSIAPVSTTAVFGAKDVTTSTSSMVTGTRLLWQNSFARRILGIVLVSTVTVTLVDFLFKARIAAAYPDTTVLAARLSTFNAVTNALAVIAQLFVGPWIFRRVGVQRALFFFPSLLFGAASGVLVSGGLAGPMLLRGIDGTLRYSVHKTSMELLLVPIPDGTRERIKPIVELFGTRGGQAIASLAILALVALGVANAKILGALALVLVVVWIALVVTIRTHYLAVFRETLRSGGLSGKAELPELDLGALEMLFTALNSSRDADVLAALEILAEQHRERLIPALILYHPSRDVVLRALEIFSQRGQADFVSIADRLDRHPDREIAAAALRARTVVLPDRRLLEARLASSCPQVAVTALVALMARRWIDLQEADGRIGRTLATRSWQTAAELARAIREESLDRGRANTIALDAMVSERFDDILVQIAHDASSLRDVACESSPSADASSSARGSATTVSSSANGFGATLSVDVRVRLEVARAMAARRSPKFLPVLVGMLSRHELRSTARSAIAVIPGALEFVDDVLSQHEMARDVRVHLPRTIVLFDPATAVRKLMPHLLTERDGAVRFKVLRGLVKLRRSNPSLLLDPDILRRCIENNLDGSEQLRRWHIGLMEGFEDSAPTSTHQDPLRAGHHLLVDLIHDKESHATQRLFMLLELFYGEDFEDIERGLHSDKPKTRASSLELVENLVRPPLRGRVLALVGDRDPRSEVASYEATLREILMEGSTTMRTLAEYRAVELGLDIEEITGRAPRQIPDEDSFGKRLASRARDLVAPEPLRVRGESSAPA